MNYIVTTTINIPWLLRDYITDFQQAGHDYEVIVIGDKKTPAKAASFCQSLPDVTYLDIKQQKKMFGQYVIYNHIPFNSIQRRNFGYLYCLQKGLDSASAIITIDDDNFLRTANFISQHARSQFTGKIYTAPEMTWLNPLAFFYPHAPSLVPRGFSAFARANPDHSKVNTAEDIVPVAVNAGLWNENPDVDAITRWQGFPSQLVVSQAESICLGRNVWCPFNSQNTAYLNGFWLTAFLSPWVGRYDDIFSSYITKRLADHFGYAILFGEPVVTQHRNDHDYYNDFLLELNGLATTDILVDFLSNLSLPQSDLLDCYSYIADSISSELSHLDFPFGAHVAAGHPWRISKLAEGMKLWLTTLDQLNVSSPVLTAAKPVTQLTG